MSKTSFVTLPAELRQQILEECFEVVDKQDRDLENKLQVSLHLHIRQHIALYLHNIARTPSNDIKPKDPEYCSFFDVHDITIGLPTRSRRLECGCPFDQHVQYDPLNLGEGHCMTSPLCFAPNMAYYLKNVSVVLASCQRHVLEDVRFVSG